MLYTHSHHGSRLKSPQVLSDLSSSPGVLVPTRWEERRTEESKQQEQRDTRALESHCKYGCPCYSLVSLCCLQTDTPNDKQKIHKGIRIRSSQSSVWWRMEGFLNSELWQETHQVRKFTQPSVKPCLKWWWCLVLWFRTALRDAERRDSSPSLVEWWIQNICHWMKTWVMQQDNDAKHKRSSDKNSD